MQEILEIENLQCGGCVSSIEAALIRLPGVQKVTVQTGKGSVHVEGPGPLPKDLIRETLQKLGYPEKGAARGFERLEYRARSVVSCLVGNLSKT
jgi:copper chaperone